MNKEKEELMNWVKHFVSVCEKNDIWYSADKETLLGAKVYNGFLPWKLKFEVMMTVESYNKLKRLYRENVIDSFVDSTFNSFSVAFVKSIFTWTDELPFISIRVVVPTKIDLANKYISFWSRITQKLSKIRVNLNSAIDFLESDEPDVCLFLEKGFKMDKTRYTKNLVYELEKVKFEDIQINVISNNATVLKSWYGENFKDVSEPNKIYSYPSPLNKIQIDKEISEKAEKTEEVHVTPIKTRCSSQLKNTPIQDDYIHSTMEISTVEEMNEFFKKTEKSKNKEKDE